jgi:glutamate synthase (NADPH/NADH) small chain
MPSDDTEKQTQSAAANAGDAAAARKRFEDVYPPLTAAQGVIEAERCYFCFDAPCVSACPTGIDIPGFIRAIAGGDLRGAAKTIFAENIFGGMCARACPTETLCERACVRELHEKQPVKIGLLQRRATDFATERDIQFFHRAADTGKRVAIVGAGPAGLSCAHALAVAGHRCFVFDARDKPGGLNEYGIAAYKTAGDFAALEVEYILAVGGITLKTGARLGRDFSLADLRAQYDAVFLGLGLGAANALGIADCADGVLNAVDFIADLRQAADVAAVKVAPQVAVIGGGMTATDAANQTRRLGAQEVTLIYRRGPREMNASEKERRLARNAGARIIYWAAPKRIIADDGGNVRAVEFERTAEDESGALRMTGDVFTLPAQMVLKAVGQKLAPPPKGGGFELLQTDGGRIAVNAERATSLSGVWAGGDCVAGGEDLTVVAVEDGKIAARAMNNFLMGKQTDG